MDLLNHKYNILFCYRNNMNPEKGGVQKVADLLAKFFISNGNKVYYLIYENSAGDNYKYLMPIYHLPDIEFFSRINLNYYHQLLNDLSIDIVINHDASNRRSVFFLNTGNSSSIKISLHHNDPTLRFNDNNNIYNSIVKKYIPAFLITAYKLYKTRKEINFLISKSSKVVLLSKAFIKKISEQTGINSDKLTAISNPILIASDNTFPKKRNQILFAGRIELKQKRPDILLLIWSKIFNLFPDWELIILGDGPDRNYIQQSSEEMELKNISFKGFVNPEPYYHEASIICMTSDYEGFGMVLIEAMQYGVVPVTFNNWASLTDIIIDNETGLLVPSGDIENYIVKLKEMMRNKELRNTMGMNAIKLVKKFDINSIGKEWLNLFDELMGVH